MTHEVRRWVRLAEKRGWTVEGGCGRHFRFLPPGGSTIVVVSSTPSDSHALANARRDLKRAGLPL